MPQFILDLGPSESHAAFDALPEFVQGYIECAFFTATRPGDCGESNGDECPQCGCTLESAEDDAAGFVYCAAYGCSFFSSAFGDEVGIGKLSAESFAGLVGAAMRFRDANAAAIAAACEGDYTESAAGNDLWHTQNGHGVGYWERRGETDAAAQALQDLDAAARKLGECDLYAGDDFRVHCSPCPKPYAAPIEPAAPPLSAVGTRYGAPMGRDSYHGEPGEPATATRVTLDAGGYDAGGAYWGIGQPLYRITATDGTALRFIRAKNGADALAKYKAGEK
jgi:hypothetical protein